MSKIFKKNETGRDFVVSDLHGCFDLFNKKLDEIEFNKETDRMFSVGDLIDRGEQNIECLNLIKEDWFFPVIGNHDEFLVKSILDGEDAELWVMNGGAWHYREDEEELINLAIMVSKLHYSMIIETDYGNIAISHAQPPSTNWNDAINPSGYAIKNMIWGRDWIKSKDNKTADGVFRSVHGHTIIKEPLLVGNAIFIDTGAFHTGKLTCVNLDF